VVEGLDAAPPEVLAVLAPLLGGRRLHLAHRAQTVPAAPGFQFLATVTTPPGEDAARRLAGTGLSGCRSVLPPSPPFI